MTGCERCDLNDKPMMSASGTFYDQQRDLHRAWHDLLRSVWGAVAVVAAERLARRTA